MASRFVGGDRDQLFLLGPDMRDWLPEGHMASLVVDTVAMLDLGELAGPPDGVGRPAYSPPMLATLLVYAYCCGIRSSRKIQRCCEQDVSFRVVTANVVPDHSTIARFRKANLEVLAGLFEQVLALCVEAGLGQVGVVAVDGTKIAGSASRAKNRTPEKLRELVDAILAEAEATDEEEDLSFGFDRRGDELPPDLVDSDERRQRLLEAKARLEARIREDDRAAATPRSRARRAHVAEQRRKDGTAAKESSRQRSKRKRKELRVEIDAALTELEANIGDRTALDIVLARAATSRLHRHQRNRLARIGAGLARHYSDRDRAQRSWEIALTERGLRGSGGKLPSRPKGHLTKNGHRRRYNTTDPDTSVMTGIHGLLQGFNAQVAVTPDQIVVAAKLTNDPTDSEHLHPILDEAVDTLARVAPDRHINTALADSGYLSATNLDRETPASPYLLIAAPRKIASGAKASPNGAITRTRERFTEAANEALYKLRGQSIEPVFGQWKEPETLAFKRFSHRGITQCNHELRFLATIHNLRKLLLTATHTPHSHTNPAT